MKYPINALNKRKSESENVFRKLWKVFTFFALYCQKSLEMIAGIGFYEKVVALQKKYNTKNLFVENTIQTNATLIDDKWAEFFGDNNFLVGISCDGPKKIHDNYRRDISGNGTFDKIMHAIELLEKYNVKYNIAKICQNLIRQRGLLKNHAI